VRWGTSPGEYTFAEAATSTTYEKQELCGPPATTSGWVDPGYFHQALITGLQEDQITYYSVGSDDHGWSREFRFHTPTKPRADAYLNITAIAGKPTNTRIPVSSIDKHNTIYTFCTFLTDLGASYIDEPQYHWMEPYAMYTTAGMADVWMQHGSSRTKGWPFAWLCMAA
jgi:hypothetical protein